MERDEETALSKSAFVDFNFKVILNWLRIKLTVRKIFPSLVLGSSRRLSQNNVTEYNDCFTFQLILPDAILGN